MLRKLALLMIPLVIFASACSSDDDNGDDSSADPTEVVSTEATNTPEAAEPTPIVIATEDLGEGTIDLDGEDLTNPGTIINAINPFSLLSGMGNGSTGTANPALQAQLLTVDDLPSGFIGMGDFAMSVPLGEGTLDMAMSMFSSGDLQSAGGDFGTMVVSSAIALPPEAQAELQNGGLEALDDFSTEDLQSAMAATEMMGIAIADIHALDASGLGDAGAGMHMAMDFSAMMEGFGELAAEVPFTGIAMDMYMFFEGDHMNMVITMYPSDDTSDADARDLAGIVDGRNNGSVL